MNTLAQNSEWVRHLPGAAGTSLIQEMKTCSGVGRTRQTVEENEGTSARHSTMSFRSWWARDGCGLREHGCWG